MKTSWRSNPTCERSQEVVITTAIPAEGNFFVDGTENNFHISDGNPYAWGSKAARWSLKQANAVPEPASALLPGLAMIGLLATRRKKSA